MEDKRAHRRRRVDRLGERDEFDTALPELIDEGYQVFDRSAEAVEALKILEFIHQIERPALGGAQARTL
jgi:hypothetical protein